MTRLCPVRYSKTQHDILISLFPGVDPCEVPLFAESETMRRSRFEFDTEDGSFCIIHPVVDFANMPVIVHEYGHMIAYATIGPKLSEVPDYRNEAAAHAAECFLALNYPVYYPEVFKRTMERMCPQVFSVVSDAFRNSIARSPEETIKRIAEGHHG